MIETHLVDAILTQKLAEGWTAKVRGTFNHDVTLSYDSEPGGSLVAPGFTDIYYSKLVGVSDSHFVEASITGDTQITQDIRNRLFASAESYTANKTRAATAQPIQQSFARSVFRTRSTRAGGKSPTSR